MIEAPLRVLFVIPAYAPFVGGAQTFVNVMARRLVADGHHVTVLTTAAQQADDYWRPPSPESQRLPGHEEMDGIHVIRLSIRYPWPAPYAFGLLRRASYRLACLKLPVSLRKWLLSQMARFVPPLGTLQSTIERLAADSDVVQVIDAAWDGLFTTAARSALAAQKPLVLTPLVHTGSKAISAHFTMPHQQEIYRCADAVLALTALEKRRLMDQGVAEEHLHIVPMGVDTAPAQIESTAVDAFRRRYELGTPLVAFVGASTYDKGAVSLVHTVLTLLRQGRSVWLACAGPQQAQLVQLIDSFPIVDRERLRQHVRLLGIVDEATKQTLLASSTVLALPSRVDSFGIVLLEAWRQGVPVVAARSGGLPEVVTDGENGLLVPFGNVEALADALVRLFDNSDWAKELGERGRQTVKVHYSWDRTYDTLIQLFRHLRRTTTDPQVRSAARARTSSERRAKRA